MGKKSRRTRTQTTSAPKGGGTPTGRAAGWLDGKGLVCLDEAAFPRGVARILKPMATNLAETHRIYSQEEAPREPHAYLYSIQTNPLSALLGASASAASFADWGS
jgi:hypothetical protein